MYNQALIYLLPFVKTKLNTAGTKQWCITETVPAYFHFYVEKANLMFIVPQLFINFYYIYECTCTNCDGEDISSSVGDIGANIKLYFHRALL